MEHADIAIETLKLVNNFLELINLIFKNGGFMLLIKPFGNLEKSSNFSNLF